MRTLDEHCRLREKVRNGISQRRMEERMSAQPEWNRTAESVENRLSNDNRPTDWLRVDEGPGSPKINHLLRPEQVAEWLNVSVEWVRDHSSRKMPRLPAIRLGGGLGRAGLLRYRASEIEKFIEQMEWQSGGKRMR
jgi:hypothetical protein